MRKSEIFDSFAKIAEEKGLLSRNPSTEAKKELENTGRADSLSVEQIAKLYGIKPSAPQGMEYQRNIVEIAHPNPLVIAPSYDKLNGLVENINERQDILLHIVNKPSPDGHLTNRKYAEKELILSLVRIGNDLDNRGQDQLVALADVCLSQAAGKSMKKVAFWPIAIAVGSLLGALYAKQHLAFHSDGLEADIQKADAELDDLLNSNSNYGVGYDYKPQLTSLASDVKSKLGELNADVQRVQALLNNIQQPRTGKELVEYSKVNNAQEVSSALQDLSQKVDQNLVPYFQQVIRNFSSDTFKQQQVAHKGMLSQIIDSTGVLHGGSGLIADDMDDVSHALQTVLADVQTVSQGLKDAQKFAQQTQQQLQAAAPSSPSAPEATPAAPPAAEAPQQLSSLEQEFGDLDDFTSLYE